MSKLAHSNQDTMDEIERLHLAEEGIRSKKCSRCGEWRCEAEDMDGCEDIDCPSTDELFEGDT